ncbi:hypothetical protein M2103_001249 [Ereboglobus sp. PH5-5]|nr:hypothetical protein [Ereboglobus sp. PH5-5]
MTKFQKTNRSNLALANGAAVSRPPDEAQPRLFEIWNLKSGISLEFDRWNLEFFPQEGTA